jgi:hypothetical protein
MRVVTFHITMDPRTCHIKRLCMMRQVWYDAELAECQGLTRDQLALRRSSYRGHFTGTDFWLGPYNLDVWSRQPPFYNAVDPEDNERCIRLTEIAMRYRATEILLFNRPPKTDWGELPTTMYNHDDPLRPRLR